MSHPTGEFFGPLDSWPTQESERDRKKLGEVVALAIVGEPIYPDDDHTTTINLKPMIAAARDGSKS